MAGYSTKDIAVIICTKNMAREISYVLDAVKDSNPGEIIIIDGHSTDNTRNICKQYTDKIYLDPGKGLSTARNIGIEKTKKDFIFFLGPDNIISSNTLQDLLIHYSLNKWAITGMLLRIKSPKGYIEFGNDFRLRVRLTPGGKPHNTVGTPYLVPKYLFDTYKYDPDVEYRDDNALMDLLKKDGYKIGRANIICYDQNSMNVKDTLKRFKMYGKGDAQYYRKNRKHWSIRRRVRSLLHPIIGEFIEPLKATTSSLDYIYAPFLFWITLIRCYSFWSRIKKI